MADIEEWSPRGLAFPIKWSTIPDHMKHTLSTQKTARPATEKLSDVIAEVHSKAGPQAAAEMLPAPGAVANDYTLAYRAEPIERVRVVKQGLPAKSVRVLARSMSMPQERLADTLGLASATLNRKSRANKPLSSDESSRVLGMTRLIGQVQVMVEESGDPQGFDAGVWVAHWLETPLPALGGRLPAELMDTPEGQSLVSDLVARLQSGAYA